MDFQIVTSYRQISPMISPGLPVGTSAMADFDFLFAGRQTTFRVYVVAF